MTEDRAARPLRIAVVGVGPRGLSVLERVISHTQGDGRPVELVLVEPGELGSGVHPAKQPDYLLLNTIASQLTIYSDERMVPGAPVTTGPDFLAWCERQGVPAAFDDFLPRRLLAEYLQWAAEDLLGRLPERLTVRHVATAARTVEPSGGASGGAAVTLADGTRLDVDLAVVTTGHGLAAPQAPAPAGDLIDAPYPLPDQVEGVPAGATVALLGTGLTAMDVIAALTVGRGGEFTDEGYAPSGREPRIVLANRTGWLPRARPTTTRERRAAPAAHLTREAVARLRERTGDGRLDFRRDVEPLVRSEALGRLAGATPEEVAAVERQLSSHHGGPERCATYEDYARQLRERAREDLAEARRGLGTSRVKEALEILRDHREGLRAALDPPGLTEESHRYFMGAYTALVNRTVIGPQKERIDELLRLMDAGVVVPGPGPDPALERAEGGGWTLASTLLDTPHSLHVDLVVRANLAWPAADPESDPVADSLRTWAALGPGGSLRLDRDGFALPREGPPPAPRAVAVFGPPAEGASYYNHYVPSPHVWSRALTDLDRVLGPVLGRVPAVGSPRGEQQATQ
ncbi:hypothetical protein BJP40_10395 [Streptomyces sp. CC53]|uniref:FAD/NAD(P)-binding protein n=1 Tax=unclassified Streptomyces TaxID=2593676 RepID=UPI0008DC93AE|nr:MULTISPECIES: FAD/NAD(P)-binding protein [unclassified Streptomyces]OII60385.1 hypothetical protein BJP40_10395 [Streptomyces sp. CC53]